MVCRKINSIWELRSLVTKLGLFGYHLWSLKPPFTSSSMESDFIFLTSCKLSPPDSKSWRYISSLIFVISSKYMLSYLSNVLFGLLLRLMVTDLTQILAWWNVGSELCYLLDCQSSETVRTHSLFLFDLDLEKGFLNIIAQNHWSKFPTIFFKGWPIFQTIVKRIPRLWFGWSIIYYSQFCWPCIFSNYWSIWH